MSAIVLLLEDDAALLELLRLAIEGWGHRVLGVAIPADAVEHARDEARIDVVIADLGALETAEYDVVARIRARHPAVRPVYMSGHLSGGPGPPDLAGGRFLQKPFPLAELEDALLGALRDARA